MSFSADQINQTGLLTGGKSVRDDFKTGLLVSSRQLNLYSVLRTIETASKQARITGQPTVEFWSYPLGKYSYKISKFPSKHQHFLGMSFPDSFFILYFRSNLKVA